MIAPPVIVKVQLSEQDLHRYFARIQERFGTKPKWIVLILTYCFLLPALPLLPHLMRGTPVTHEAGLLAVLLLVMGVAILIAFHRTRERIERTWLNSLEGRRAMLPTTITVSAEGVDTTAPSLEARITWALVHSVERSAGVTYIWLGRGEGMPIPDRTFANAAEADAFAELVMRLHREAPGHFECPQCAADLRGRDMPGCPKCGWGRDTMTHHET